MLRRPKVSICMPVLNRKAFLPASVASVLEQVLDDWELLVSDAGSVDGTRELLERYSAADPRIRWFDHPGLNVSQARNALLREAAGEYVAVLDSDDAALPERLSAQTAFLDCRADLLGAGTNIEFIDGAGLPSSSPRYPFRLTDPAELRSRLLEGWGCFAHTSMMMRRSALLEADGYREVFSHAEDDDLFLRLLERGDLANMPEVLTRYRCHDENSSRPGRPLYRAVALASAHLRRAGLPDPVDTRRTPVDYGFFQEMLHALGADSLPVRLFWIGMLQCYREGGPEPLREAWRQILALPHVPGKESEILRHWNTLRKDFPEENAWLSALPGALTQGFGKWLSTVAANRS